MKKQLSFADWIISQNISEDDPLRKIFSSVDFSFIENLVPEKSVGRKGFSPVSLFKALLLIPLGEARSQRELAHRLRFDGRLCYLCGFTYGQTPSHNTFTVFKKRVGERKFKVILERLISQTLCLIKENKVSAVIDSTSIKTHFASDRDARWGVKPESKECSFFFGYKLHTSVIHGRLPVPASFEVTPGSAYDGNFFKKLLSETSKKIKVKNAIADAGYDTLDNISYSKKRKIQPYIRANPRNSKNSLTSSKLTITLEGEVFCPGGKKLIYWGKEKRRKRFKFRCPLFKENDTCLFKESCWKGKYGRSFYISEFHTLSQEMKLFRTTKRFKKIYKKRQCVERFFSLLKERFSLEHKLKVREMENIKIYVYIVLSAYVASLFARGFG